MYGRRLPQRDRVRSLSVPIMSVVSVAVMALAATIHATGRGSGVMVSYTNVLNQEFSTAQAICPVKARANMMTQVRDERFEVGVCMASFRFGCYVEELISSLLGCTGKEPNLYQCTSILNAQQDDECRIAKQQPCFSLIFNLQHQCVPQANV